MRLIIFTGVIYGIYGNNFNIFEDANKETDWEIFDLPTGRIIRNRKKWGLFQALFLKYRGSKSITFSI